MPARPRRLTHLDASGRVHMVGVGDKPIQRRRATASATLICRPATILALRAQALPKGDVLTTAKIAGIQAAKSTSHLIPLCHPLPLSQINVDLQPRRDRILVTCTVETEARTGVEMEALTGATVAALTLYDMCKAVDKAMHIEAVRLVEKVKQ